MCSGNAEGFGMKITPTISLYLARAYATSFIFMLGLLLGIVYLFDTVELLRRAGGRADMSLGLVLQMSFYKIPEVGQMILPFAILFSAIFTFWRLSRRHELVVVRSAGLSVWQFLAPIMGVAAFLGVLQFAAINPVGAILMSKFEAMESTYLRTDKSLVTLFDEGLWLRQYQPEGDGYIVLHAERIALPDWELKGVMALFYGQDDAFVKRIDAGTARLSEGEWNFNGVMIHSADAPAESIAQLSLPTSLTVGDIEESFSSPMTQSFWKIPGYIRTLTEAGFDATGMKIHFQALLAQPVLFMAMVLLAATVSLRPPRAQRAFGLIVIGVMMGFVVFFLSSFLQALGASQQIPVMLAAWAPGVVTLLLGLAMMLVFEDG